jgi:tetratricopeptide (TPR) repeat protein
MSELDFPKKLLEIGDREGAVKELVKFLRSKPRDVDAWFFLAQAIDDKNKKADCYRQILRIDPTHDLAQENLRKLFTPSTSTSESQNSPGVIKDTNNRKMEQKQVGRILQFLESDKVFTIALPLMIVSVVCLVIVILGLPKLLPALNTQPTAINLSATSTQTQQPYPTRIPTQTPDTLSQ